MNQKVEAKDVKPPEPSTAVGTPIGGAVVNWRDQAAKDVAQVTQQERASASSISLRAGVISYQNTPVPGNKLRVIIVDAAYERTYYEGAFDPDNITSPRCFALAKATQDAQGKWGYYNIVPDPSIHEPIHPTCEGCKLDAWGSDVRDGKKRRGKACKERRRLAVIPAREASQLTVEAILAAELAIVKTPVTSVRFYAAYVQSCASLLNRPPYGVITELSTQPDAKNQFNLTFQAITKVDDELMGAILKKREMIQSSLMKPYDPKGEDEEPAQPAQDNKAPRKY